LNKRASTIYVRNKFLVRMYLCVQAYILEIPLMMMMWITGWKWIWKMNKKHTVLMMAKRGVAVEDLMVL
jgi:hypothetical protein